MKSILLKLDQVDFDSCKALRQLVAADSWEEFFLALVKEKKEQLEALEPRTTS